jgi:LiaI-LiaF-like transmembrane region
MTDDRGSDEPHERHEHSEITRSYRASLTWPVLLITLGLMFLLDEFAPQWGFRRTWPVLLVVIGILKLIESGRPPRPPAGPRV